MPKSSGTRWGRLGSWVGGLRDALGAVREAVDLNLEPELPPTVSPGDLAGLSLIDVSETLPDEFLEGLTMERLLEEARACPAWEQPLEQVERALERFLAGKRVVLAINGPRGSGRACLLDHACRRLKELAPELSQRRVHIRRAEAPREALAELREAADGGEEERRLVRVERGHRLYLRKVGGLDPLREALSLVSASSERVLWLVEVDSIPWRYLDYVVQLSTYFDQALAPPELEPSDLRELFERRLRALREVVALEFVPPSGLLIDDRPRWRGELYYDRLHETSRGNLEAARELFLGSARYSAQGKRLLVLAPPLTPHRQVLDTLAPGALPALAALLEHEALSPEELADLLLVELGEARATLEPCQRFRVVEPVAGEPGRFSVRAPWRSPLAEFLEEWNLL